MKLITYSVRKVLKTKKKQQGERDENLKMNGTGSGNR